jgi:peptide/nickel transport system ATP-binding protein
VQKLIETRDLYTNFFTFEGVVKALNGVSMIVNRGETYGLVGESGCGKSVTVQSMMRIVQTPGRIVDGKIILFLNRSDMERGIDIIKRGEAYMQSIRGCAISMIFQEAGTSLNPVFTIGRQVGESFHFHRKLDMLGETIKDLNSEISAKGFFPVKGWKTLQKLLFQKELNYLKQYESKVGRIDSRLFELEGLTDPQSLNEKTSLVRLRERLSKKDPLIQFIRRIPFLKRYYKRLDRTITRHVVDILKELGVPNPENIVNRYPHELSGGMQQRIVIAIALSCHPTLLIADEPTSNLDVTIQAQIIDLIRTLKKTTISSVLFITHDLGLVAEICDKVSVMYAGDICETAAVKELFRNPLHPYSVGLLNSVPKIDQTGQLETIYGTVPNLINPPTGCRFHPRCPHAMKICAVKKPLTVEYSKDHYVACYLYDEKEKEA